MRLIDADALVTTIKNSWDWNTVDGISATAVLKQTISDIKNEPVITAISPKQGKWIPHPNPKFMDYDVCTACGIGCKRREHITENGQTYETEHSYLYCPNCGARMEITICD